MGNGRLIVEKYIQGIAGDAEISFEWLDSLNGAGSGYSYAGTASRRDIGPGRSAHVQLTNSIARDITTTDGARLVAAHEAAHVRAYKSEECKTLDAGGGPFGTLELPWEGLAQSMTEIMGVGQVDMYPKATQEQIDAVLAADC